MKNKLIVILFIALSCLLFSNYILGIDKINASINANIDYAWDVFDPISIPGEIDVDLIRKAYFEPKNGGNGEMVIFSYGYPGISGVIANGVTTNYVNTNTYFTIQAQPRPHVFMHVICEKYFRISYPNVVTFAQTKMVW